MGWDCLYLDSLINDHFQAYVGGSRFVNPIFYSLANEVLSVCMDKRGQNVQGGSCNRFLSEERASHSAILFTAVLRSNSNRIYSFSCIGDTKFPKLTGGYTTTS